MHDCIHLPAREKLSVYNNVIPLNSNTTNPVYESRIEIRCLADMK